MKKILLTLLLLLTVSFALIFTLSSKGSPNFDEPSVNCNDEANWNITLVFPPNTSGHPGRAATYEHYIPTSDMRNNSLDIGLSKAEVDKYYCVVTVTSPSCTDYSRTFRAKTSNGYNGNFTISVPKYEPYRVKVEYYEARGAFPWASPAYRDIRLKYTADKSYSIKNGVSDAFYLTYGGTVDAFAVKPPDFEVDGINDLFEEIENYY